MFSAINSAVRSSAVLRMFGATLVATCLFSYPSAAEAIRQYRCNGMVQYRPCDNPGDTSVGLGIAQGTPGLAESGKRSGSQTLHSSTPHGHYARITRQGLTKVTTPRRGFPPDGIWKGAVQGRGQVHLYLEISKADKTAEQRYMGNVAMHGNETTFAFVSSLPRDSHWTWNVRAVAAPLGQAAPEL